MHTRLIFALFLVTAACGDDGVHHLADAPPSPIDAPADAAVDSPDPMVALDVTVAGAGSGTVTSSPAGITCASGTCTGDFDPSTVVTLSAVPGIGSVFAGWSGGCTGTTPTCEVTLAQAASVTATFDVARYAVTLTKSGPGTGTVAGNGINCGTTCTVMVDHGTMLSLTQAPGNLSVFAGWGGACSGTGGCMTTVTGPTTITANFALDNLTLFVTKGGNGAGSVTATGISCGADCSESYTANQMVTLTAVASTGSTFTGWSGGGCTGTGACTVTMTAAITVTATFTLQQLALTVMRAGTGSGNVVSTPAGIACGVDCTENLDYNTMVTLTATPSTGSSFSGWSGACTGTAMCVVTMTQARSVTATFTLMQLALTTTVAGNGTITSAPAGIACPADCTQNYNYGQVVVLAATAGTGSTFAGWGGACTGTGACSVTIDAAKNVTATFTLDMFTLTVTKGGTGTGTVTGTGIACGVDCSETVSFGTMITLTPTASTGSTFAGWAGACTGTGACTVTVDAAKSVAATFNLQTFTLSAARGGNGTGTITSSPAGITCGVDCSEVYSYGTMVALTAIPATGSTFTGWSGACTNATGTCNVTVDAAKSATATFTLMTFPVAVTRAGGGTGTVTSSPAGITCGATCTSSFDYGQSVTLTATPSAPGSTFAGWSGGGCSGTSTCTVSVLAAVNVTATFDVAMYDLAVNTAGTGLGSVSSTPAGITCPGTCTKTYVYNTSVTLTPAADVSSDFTGWSGACTGTGGCTVSMTAMRSVTATFTKKQVTLSVKFSGDGKGTITANGQSCTSACLLAFPYGSTITMTATAGSLQPELSTFIGWSGAGCTGTAGCSFTLTALTQVDGNFQFKPNLMFTTSGAYDGNLGGLAGADAKCQALAGAANRKGNYRAYLGASTGDAKSRFAGASGWTLVDGSKLVNAIGEFGTVALPIAPTLDENGNDLTASGNTLVWTASLTTTAYYGASCGDWSTNISSVITTYGICTYKTATVIQNKTEVCAAKYRLYCFGVDRAATLP